MKTFLITLSFFEARKTRVYLLGSGGLILALLSLVEPIFFREIIDTLANVQDINIAYQYLGWIIIFWLSVAGFNMLLRIAITYNADVLVHNLHVDIWQTAIEKVLRLSMRFHNSRKTGSTMRRIERGADNMFEIQLDFLREDLPRIFSLIFLLPLIFWLHFKMALMLCLILPIILTLATWGSYKTNKLQAEVESQWTKASGSAFDAVANISVIKSFTAFTDKMSEISKLIFNAHFRQLQVLKWWCFIIVLGRSAALIATMAVFIFGAYLNLNGEITIGEIVMFSGYSLMIVHAVESELWHFQRFMWRKSKIDEFFEIWDEVPEVKEDANAIVMPHVKGKVEFDRVYFSHEGDRYALNGVSFEVIPGETVALVGHTGSGKTTTVNLLSRFFDLNKGQIYIDDYDISKVTLESLRKNVGMVFQENVLFHENILYNLKIGNSQATMDQVQKACKTACIHDLIMSLPKQYDTIVGERGVKLSGGEKQRVAIARAILKNPPILVLDEATSALDAETERKIQNALSALIKGRTTFVVAHRLSTIKNADNILVFDCGKIVETGKFDSLMNKKGVFYHLVNAQVSGFII